MLVHFKISNNFVPYLYSAGLTLGVGLLLKPTMIPFNISFLQGTLETIVAGLTVVSVLGAGLLKLRNHLRAVSKTLNELAVLPKEFTDMKKEVGTIRAQLLPNGGKSVADRVDKLANGQSQTHEVLTTLAGSVAALARKQQASFHLSDRCLLEFDATGRCIFANRAYLRFTGRTEGELMGTGWASVIHPEDRRDLSDMWDTAVESKSSMEVSVRVSTVAGHFTAGVLQMTAVFTGHSLVAWLGVFTPEHLEHKH